MTQTDSAILAHARRCAPAESCGFVVRTPEGERYIPCVNISGEPEEYCKRLVRTVLIFTESSDQLSRATDRVP
ncbi:Mov34/MPN/PAD-1 family protein, partial [Escherichia coli]|nr:Mov34/MPN/PAD-1 family protein [Escherichia coli]